MPEIFWIIISGENDRRVVLVENEGHDVGVGWQGLMSSSVTSREVVLELSGGLQDHDVHLPELLGSFNRWRADCILRCGFLSGWHRLGNHTHFRLYLGMKGQYQPSVALVPVVVARLQQSS